METLRARRVPLVWTGVVATAVLGAISIGLVIALGSSGATAAATYQTKAVRLASGKTTVARWNPCQRAITWKVNFRGITASQRSTVLSELQEAFSRLAAATGMTYRYAGKATFVPRQENLVSQPADIVVAAINASDTDLAIGERSLGFGGVLWATWYGDSGEGAAVVRGYVVLIPSAISRLKRGFGPGKTIGNVILHELGHASGLEHVNNSRSLMYPTLTTSTPNGWSSGDKAGLAQVGRRMGCIDIPARVNIKDYD